eukprot:5812394-Amphidinium_carterae.1
MRCIHSAVRFDSFGKTKPHVLPHWVAPDPVAVLMERVCARHCVRVRPCRRRCHAQERATRSNCVMELKHMDTELTQTPDSSATALFGD